MYAIHPILCGTLSSTKSALTYRVDRGMDFEFPIYAFLVVPVDPDDETVVLVDTGLVSTDSAYMRGRGRDVGAPGGGAQPLVDGLAEYGYVPKDVDIVVLTHLHHDHTANIDRFDDAEFVVQRRELDAARDPIPILASAYRDGALAELDAQTIRIVDGDTELRDGIDLLLTPGHTEGMQSVVVETAAGPCALIGDLAYGQHNLQPGLETIRDASGRAQRVTPMEMDYIPPGTHVDVAACYESIARLRERVGPAGLLVSSHDPTAVADLEAALDSAERNT